MLFDDTYRTIAQPAEGLFRDRGSKFLSFAYPIKKEAEVKDLVANLKSIHLKANHHCWAVRLTTDRSIFRINDDGEPAGTAGRPILNVLLSNELTNLALIVVRYFGGTLLGVPGLINAYKMAAIDALNQAAIVEKTVNDVYTLHFDHLQINDVMKIVKDNDVTVIDQLFDNSCSITLSIRKMQVNPILVKLNKLTGVKINYLNSL